MPGISGSTAAVLTGIYEDLIHSVNSINRWSLRLLAQKKFREFWRIINGNFLITVIAGISTSFLLGARLISYALKHHPVPIGSFFFSFMVMATPLVMREEIKKMGYGGNRLFCRCPADRIRCNLSASNTSAASALGDIWRSSDGRSAGADSRDIVYLYFDTSRPVWICYLSFCWIQYSGHSDFCCRLPHGPGWLLKNFTSFLAQVSKSYFSFTDRNYVRLLK